MQAKEAHQALVTCHICDLLQEKVSLAPGSSAKCSRCSTTLYKSRSTCISFTLAYSVAALIMLIPAHTFPIMIISKLGKANEATLMESIIMLFEEGTWAIGALVFFASVFTPIAKLMGLFYLALTARSSSFQQRKTELYHLVEYIGRWSMVDVFLVAVLVGVVKLGDIVNVTVGVGSVAFSAAVVFTILAANNFDPKVIWEDE